MVGLLEVEVCCTCRSSSPVSPVLSLTLATTGTVWPSHGTWLFPGVLCGFGGACHDAVRYIGMTTLLPRIRIPSATVSSHRTLWYCRSSLERLFFSGHPSIVY